MQLARFHQVCLRSARVMSTSVAPALPDSAKSAEVATTAEKPAAVQKKDDMANNVLIEFFDDKENWGKSELRPLFRPGRSWTTDELRLKSNSDLHKLWYVLLKERNMLLTMFEAYSQRAKIFPNPERLDRVKESMDNIEAVVHERNDAFLKLETGDGASPPMRTVTSFMGFTYKKQASEHYEPFEVSNKKEYEVPYLDDDAYLMQRLWKEKEFLKKDIADYDTYFNKVFDVEQRKFGRGTRKYYDRIEDIPRTVLQHGTEAERRERLVESRQNTDKDTSEGAENATQKKTAGV